MWPRNPPLPVEDNSSTVPHPPFTQSVLPPWLVVVKRLPAPSMVTAVGSLPSLPPVNACSFVYFTPPEPLGASLNTSPQPLGQAVVCDPPNRVVPYKLPDASKARGAAG